MSLERAIMAADIDMEPTMSQGHKVTKNIFNQWKSLPNLWLSQNCETLKEKRFLYRRTRGETVTIASSLGRPENQIERSKSMDFMCCIETNPYSEERDVSTFDLYLSKDFTDLMMNTSFSERSDVDSMEAKLELEESLDNWTELRSSSELTQSNLTQSLASRMYSYENLDRVGKNHYKIKKWFQRCSFDESEDDEVKEENHGNLQSTS